MKLATQAPLDFEAVNAAALAVYPRLLQRWLPNGRLYGREFRVGNINGDTGDSLSVNIQTGLWSDFATDVSGSDPISLYAALNGLGQGEACRQLSNELGLANGAATPLPKAKPKDDWRPILPAPVAPPQNPAHPKLGRPDSIWTYRSEDGMLLFLVCRFDKPDGKAIFPLTYGTLNGAKGWHWKHASAPMPLYGLDKLRFNPDGAVLVVEGEKAADAAQRLLPGIVVVTWPRGTQNVGHVDWSPLAGRRVGIWPDNDVAGIGAAEKIAAQLHTIGAQSVSIIDPPKDVRQKWDLADAEAEKWTGKRVIETMKANKREPNAATVTPLRPDTESPRTQETSWPTAPDAEAFYGLSGRFCELVKPHTESDPVALLGQFLTAFGNIIGPGPYYRVESTLHRCNFNTIYTGETSKGRKGTALNNVRRLFEMVQPEWADCIIKGLGSGEGVIWHVRDQIEKKEAVREKGRVVDYQNVIADHGVTDKRLLVIEEEFAAVLKVCNRENSTLSTTLRNAWDSGNLRIANKNSPVRATGAHISIIGHITRDELLRHLETTEAANGFGNRFLWLCVRRSKTLPDGGNLRDEDFRQVASDLAAAVRFARDVDEMRRDDEARQIWHRVYPELSEGRPGLLGAMIGRSEAQVLRLSMIYALLDCSAVIKKEHLYAALALWSYAEDSAEYIFGDSMGDPVVDRIKSALGDTPAGMSKTEISNLFGRNVSAHQIDRALDDLARRGKAAKVSETSGPSGGRPIERWKLV